MPRPEDEATFSAALRAVRTFGGVLEHPAYSKAWSAYALPRPPAYGWASDLPFMASGEFCEGLACEVDQAHYGHPANKRTWLYYVGPCPPAITFGRAPETGRTVRNDGGGGRDQRSRTPPAFRDVLLDLARSASVPVLR